MLVIRLARIGRTNTTSFRIVLQEKTQAPKAKAQEILGSYNPLLKKREDQVHLEKERILYWLSKGAQASATVHNMLIEFGVTTGKKRRSVQPKKKQQEGAAQPASAGAAPAATKATDATAAEAKPAAEQPTEQPAEKKEAPTEAK